MNCNSHHRYLYNLIQWVKAAGGTSRNLAVMLSISDSDAETLWRQYNISVPQFNAFYLGNLTPAYFSHQNDVALD